MFFRVRTTLPDAPGALALLATRCGEAGVNILALQIYPDLGSVTDDLVIRTPDDWTAAAVVDLVGGAGGDEVSVSPCTTHDLLDQPAQWLAAARAVVADPDALPGLLRTLLGTRASWSATEQVRASSLEAIAEAVRERAVASAAPGQVLAALPDPTDSSAVDYDLSETGVVARIGRHAVGAAVLESPADGTCQATLEVAPAWRRLGIGRALLRRLASLAVTGGAEELVLRAPASDDGVAPMLAACGLRGRIRLTADGLFVHIGLAGVPPLERTDRPAR